MSGRHANAKDVLPPRLLLALQKYWQGSLWIPVTRARRRKTGKDAERNRRIVRAYGRGMSMRRLGQSFSLSQERIRQIVRGAKGSG
jgi:Mor family transcriptional regulator